MSLLLTISDSLHCHHDASMRQSINISTLLPFDPSTLRQAQGPEYGGSGSVRQAQGPFDRLRVRSTDSGSGIQDTRTGIQSPKSRIQSSGFSLIELSITLTIIGIIIAIITSGSHVLEAARTHKLITELQHYQHAIQSFRQTYRAWPGDMADAEDIWGSYHATSHPSGTINGNGDERITMQTGEPLRAWQQLGLSGIISHHYSGQTGEPFHYQPDINTPKAILPGIFFHLHYNSYYPQDSLDKRGNFLMIVSNESETSPLGAAFPPQEAYLLDKKMDDALPSSGKILGMRSHAQREKANSCTDASYLTDDEGHYLLQDTTTSCRVLLLLEP